MELDISEIIIAGVLCIVVLFDGLLKYRKWNDYQQVYDYLRIGLLMLLSATIFNSLVEGKWNLNYIISFLSLKQAGRWWMFRLFASIGYICLAMAIEILIIVKYKKNKNNSKG